MPRIVKPDVVCTDLVNNEQSGFLSSILRFPNLRAKIAAFFKFQELPRFYRFHEKIAKEIVRTQGHNQFACLPNFMRLKKSIKDACPVGVVYYPGRESNSYDWIYDIVQKDGKLLKLASNEIRNNLKICLAAVKQNPEAVQFVSDALLLNNEILLTASTSKTIDLVLCFRLKIGAMKTRNFFHPIRHKEILENCLASFPNSIRYLSKECRNCKNLAKIALSRSAKSFAFLGAKPRNDEEFVRMAIAGHPDNFMSLSVKFRKNKEIVQLAIQRDPSLIAYSHKSFYLDAVYHNGELFDYFDKWHFTEDFFWKCAASENAFFAMRYLFVWRHPLCRNKNFIAECIQNDPDSFYFVSDELKTIPICVRAYRADKDVEAFIPLEIRKDVVEKVREIEKSKKRKSPIVFKRAQKRKR